MSAAALTPSRSLGAGTAWTGAAFAVNKLTLFASTVVLARLLEPRDFGLVAVALVIVSFVERLSEGGLETAIVASPHPERTVIHHAAGLSLVLGGVLCLAGFGSASWVAAALGEPDAGPVLATLSVLYLTSSLRQVASGGLGRRNAFRRRAMPEVLRATVKATVMIGLAVAGWGVWALTLGHVAGALIGTIAMWVALGQVPRPQFSRVITPSLARVGSGLTAVAFLGAVSTNLDVVILAARSEAAVVGVYAIAFRLPDLTVRAVPLVMSQPLIAAYSQALRQGGAIGGIYREGLATAMRLLLPMGVGLALISEVAVEVLFGESWATAAPVMRTIALSSIAAGAVFPLGDLLKACGHAAMLARLAVVRLVILAPLLWAAAGSGIESVALVHLGVSVAMLVLNAVVFRRHLPLGAGDHLAVLLPPAIATAAMAAAVLVTQAVLAGGPVELVATVVAGAAVYVVAWVAQEGRPRSGLLDDLVGSSGS